MDKYSVTITWTEEDEMFVAICPELGNVSALGVTRGGALVEIQIVIRLAVASYRDRGLAVPEPLVA